MFKCSLLAIHRYQKQLDIIMKHITYIACAADLCCLCNCAVRKLQKTNKLWYSIVVHSECTVQYSYEHLTPLSNSSNSHVLYTTTMFFVLSRLT